MGKKKIIIIISAVLLAVSAAAVAVFGLSRSGEAAYVFGTGPLLRAQRLENFMRIEEGRDLPLLSSSAEAETAWSTAASQLKDGVCSSVIVKTKLLSKSLGSDKTKTPGETELDSFFRFAQEAKKNGVSVYAEADISLWQEFYSLAVSDKAVEGLVLTGAERLSAAQTEKRLSVIRRAAEYQNEKARLILSVPAKKNELLKTKEADGFLVNLKSRSRQGDLKKQLDAVSSFLGESNREIYVGFDLSDYSSDGLPGNELLLNLLALDGFDFVSGRVFSRLSFSQRNFDGCFSAAEKYLSKGIKPKKAFAELEIESESAETEEKISVLKLHGSNLFPFYVDGAELYPDENGFAEKTLSLKTGENRFSVSQCGKKAEYKIKSVHSGSLIEKIEPMPSVSAFAGDKIKITVIAADKSSVTVRAGSERFEAKKTGEEKDGLARYTAAVVMPKSKIEAESVGALAVTAVLGEKVSCADGPVLIFKERALQSTQPKTEAPTAKQEETTIKETLPAGNFEAPSTKPPQTAPTVPPVSVQRPQNMPTVESQNVGSQTQTFVPGQMCVVSIDAADTWPAGADSNDFVPFYTPLIKGTSDYVVGQSEAKDEDGKKTRYFFDLASGRRVQREAVTLVNRTNPGDNEISVLSCENFGGDLVLKLKTKWYAPYSFGFSPQSYYSGHGNKYNVHGFTANKIDFTFYHTTVYGGFADSKGSETVGDGFWTGDAARKTATLSFPLKKAGGYYGYSIEYDAAGGIALTIHKKPQSLSGTVVVLDPGHGGKDPGALGFSGAVYESRLNFALAAEIASQLQSKGATVYLTRYGDSNMSLEERKSFARRVKPDLFISVHANGSENPADFGTSSFYFRPMSKPLAQAVHGEMTSLFKNEYYPGDSSKGAKINRGCLFYPFSVARLEDCPSMLLEVGFITNNEECTKMADQSLRVKTAAAVCRGIEKYVTSA